ncbi:MAG TPA: glycoside hydrolase family 28 protein [Terriglobales bacterium]|nr:glycoside hydrolase family 28 protein [Terriglobales bacterium]
MTRIPASRRSFLSRLSQVTSAAGLFALADGAGAQLGAVGSDRDAYDVTAFGARGDGKTLDTAAINQAITAAAARGGGTVTFPAGTYLSYSIRLESNVGLKLGHGCTLVAAEGTGYDAAESNLPWENYQDYGHNHWHNSLLWGEQLHDVSISGPGMIWGRGLSRGEGPPPLAETPGAGNKSIAFKNCSNVVLRDFSILHGGHFGILATGVDGLRIENLQIDTNRDGMDIDCCRNVHIAHCSVNSPWDDAIVLKSSYALGFARATEMVTIHDCLVTGGYEEGTLLKGTFKHFDPERQLEPYAEEWRTGRIKFGTESNGGFKNITIANCVFDSCHGLAVESVDGAHVEDIAITNLTMRQIYEAPIFIRLGSRMRGPAGAAVGVIRRVLISNVVCSNATSPICSIISGVPGHNVEEVRLSNIVIEHEGGGTPQQAKLRVPEKETEYPDPDMFGAMPAHGFFLRHVRGIEMDGIKILARNRDERPAFVLEDVEDASFTRPQVPVVAGVPLFALSEVENFRLRDSAHLPDMNLPQVAHQEILPE